MKVTLANRPPSGRVGFKLHHYPRTTAPPANPQAALKQPKAEPQMQKVLDAFAKSVKEGRDIKLS